MFHIKWSYGSDGLTDVWENGTKVISRAGPNTYNDETGNYDAAHHPFTSPMDEDLEKFKTAIEDERERHLLGEVRAKAYDAVINGYECAGGSIRIHQKSIQALNFKALVPLMAIFLIMNFVGTVYGTAWAQFSEDQFAFSGRSRFGRAGSG